MKKIISALLVVMCFGGCSVMGPKVPLELRPGQGIEEDQLHLRASGVNRFQCVKDNQGYYWKFDSASAQLGKTEPKGKADVIATMRTNGRENYFIHKDGSSLFTQKIDKTKKSYAPEKHLSHARFRVNKTSSQGAFAGVRYILRVNTRKGMPVIPCDAGNFNDFHDVKFKATYVFWK